MVGVALEQTEQKTQAPLVERVIVDGLIEIDQDDYLGEIRKRVIEAHPSIDEEKYKLLYTIPQALLKEAITVSQDPSLPDADKNAVSLATSDKLTRMSEIIKGGYGVCRHFHTISLLVAQEAGLEFALQGNERYRHTFGRVKINGEWRIVDPFAEVYFRNRGEPRRFFPGDCYLSPDVETFAITTFTSPEEIEKVSKPKEAQPSKSVERVSLQELLKRSEQSGAKPTRM